MGGKADWNMLHFEKKRKEKKAHQVDEKPHTQLKWPTKGDDYQLIHLINLAANLSVGNISGVNIFLFIL